MTEIMLVLVQIICAPSILILIMSLSKFRYSRRATIITTTLTTIFLILLDFFIVLKGGHLLEPYPFLDFVYRISNILFAVAVAAFLTRQPVRQTLFIVLSVCIGTYIVDTIALTIRTILELYPLELMFELVLYPIMIMLFIRMRRPFLDVIEYMKGSLWPLCLASAFLLVCFLLQISIPDRLVDTPENIPVALMLCCVTITLYGLFYYLFQTMHSKVILEHKAMAMKVSISTLENQNHIAAQNEKKVSLFKHDIRHVMQMMSVCLDSGDISGAKELLAGMDKNIGTWETSVTRSFTNHKLLDGTLCYYIGLARESGIDITVRMNSIDGISVDMVELSVVLANALENAVRECGQSRDGEPRIIRLDGRKRGRQYFLEIANTYDGEVCFDSETGLPASKGNGHGIGSRSIAYFAEKNGATLQYHLEGRWFHLRLLM